MSLVVIAAPPAARAQIKATKEQMMFYTSGWKGERFPDGRPKLPDGLLERAKNVHHRGRLGLPALERLQLPVRWQLAGPAYGEAHNRRAHLCDLLRTLIEEHE
jgi:hypothetical protein